MSKSHPVMRHLEDDKLLRKWNINTPNVNKVQVLPSQMEKLEQTWGELIEEYLQNYRKTLDLLNTTEEKNNHQAQMQQSEYEVIQTACQILKERSMAVHKMFLFDIPNRPAFKTPKPKNGEENGEERNKNKTTKAPNNEEETTTQGKQEKRDDNTVEHGGSEVEVHGKDGSGGIEEDEMKQLSKTLTETQEKLEKEESMLLDLLKGLDKSRWNEEQFQNARQKWQELALLLSSEDSSDSDLAFLREIEKEMKSMICVNNVPDESGSNTLESWMDSNKDLEDKWMDLREDALNLKAMCEMKRKSGNKPILQSTQVEPFRVGGVFVDNHPNDSNETRLWDNILL